MAKKKVSRKKLLKEPDEFISTTGQIIQYIKENRKQVTRSALIVALVAIVAAGTYTYLRWRASAAAEFQQSGFQHYQEGLSEAGNPEAAQKAYRSALERFQKSIATYGWGEKAQISQLFIGHCYYALKEYGQAEKAYSRCLQGPFRAIAYDGLGHSYEAGGQYQKAMESYQKNAEVSNNPYQLESLLGEARCLELLNQKEKALKVYQEAQKKFPKSAFDDFLQWKIGALKG
jgi:tetratricopeptide (TPR) repeat protein